MCVSVPAQVSFTQAAQELHLLPETFWSDSFLVKDFAEQWTLVAFSIFLQLLKKLYCLDIGQTKMSTGKI